MQKLPRMVLILLLGCIVPLQFVYAKNRDP
jgi:hypothetical protein